MSIGNNIKKYRTIKELSQRELAKLTGISESSIRKYEHGERKPKIENLIKIERALGINLSIDSKYCPHCGEEL